MTGSSFEAQVGADARLVPSKSNRREMVGAGRRSIPKTTIEFPEMWALARVVIEPQGWWVAYAHRHPYPSQPLGCSGSL